MNRTKPCNGDPFDITYIKINPMEKSMSVNEASKRSKSSKMLTGKLIPTKASEASGRRRWRCDSSRETWMALPARVLTKQWLLYVIVSATSTRACSSLAECSFQARFIQQFHMQRQGWGDIIYNFLVGDDGRVYVGKDWNNVDVFFIGAYDKMLPLKTQLNTLQALIENGIETGKLSPDYKLLANKLISNDNNTTPNPGDTLYQDVTILVGRFLTARTHRCTRSRET